MCANPTGLVVHSADEDSLRGVEGPLLGVLLAAGCSAALLAAAMVHTALATSTPHVQGQASGRHQQTSHATVYSVQCTDRRGRGTIVPFVKICREDLPDWQSRAR